MSSGLIMRQYFFSLSGFWPTFTHTLLFFVTFSSGCSPQSEKLSPREATLDRTIFNFKGTIVEPGDCKDL